MCIQVSHLYALSMLFIVAYVQAGCNHGGTMKPCDQVKCRLDCVNKFYPKYCNGCILGKHMGPMCVCDEKKGYVYQSRTSSCVKKDDCHLGDLVYE